MTASAGHVFVSHSSDNRELANELAGFLEKRGIKVWIAPRDVRPGMDYSEELQIAIEACSAFVVLVTEMANKSPYVRAETEMAFSSHKPIFPVRIADIKPAAGLALFLKIRHWTDAYGPGKSDSLDRLTRELQAVSKPAAAPSVTDAPAAAAAPPQPPAAPAVGGAGVVQAPVPAAAAPAPPPPPPPPTRPPVAPMDPQQEEKWRAAVGPKADYYLERWRQMDAKGSSVSWNWAACLASVFWFAYRKMWLWMAGLWVAIILLALLGTPGGAMARISFVLSIGITFVTGAFGNLMYRKHLAKLVAETSTFDRQTALDALRRRGGASVVALVVSVGVVVLLTLILVVAAAMALEEKGALDPERGIQGSVGGFEAGSGDPMQGISGQTGGEAADQPAISGQIGDGADAPEAEGDKPEGGFDR